MTTTEFQTGPVPPPNVAGDHLIPPVEAKARRLLGLDAGFSTLIGLAAVVLGGPLGRQVGLPSKLVRATGLAVSGMGVGVGVASVAEDWQSVTRIVAGANLAATAGLLGHTAAKGTAVGRVITGLLAADLGWFAYHQVQALMEVDGGVVA